jgi:hypothetical protein
MLDLKDNNVIKRLIIYIKMFNENKFKVNKSINISIVYHLIN